MSGLRRGVEVNEAKYSLINLQYPCYFKNKVYSKHHYGKIRSLRFNIMHKKSYDTLPLPVKRSLKKFGADIRIARIKRGFTLQMMAERLGVHRTTYAKVEKGDEVVGIGIYAAVLFVLGLRTPFSDLIDISRDDTGLMLDLEKLPKRVRTKKTPQTL